MSMVDSGDRNGTLFFDVSTCREGVMMFQQEIVVLDNNTHSTKNISN